MGQVAVRSSESWLEALQAQGAVRDQAVGDLHALLLRAARFELRRRRAALSHVRGEELEPEVWPEFADRSGGSPEEWLEADELVRALRAAIDAALTPHQRTVFTALALGQVPIDVLSERLGTTRGALYKTLHDARRKLRAELAAGGYVDGAAPPLRERR